MIYWHMKENLRVRRIEIEDTKDLHPYLCVGVSHSKGSKTFELRPAILEYRDPNGSGEWLELEIVL